MNLGKTKEEGKSVRALLVGYPGAGKTGSIASLINEGYKVRVIDFEGNIEPLLAYVKPEFYPNVDIVYLRDKLAMGDKYAEAVGVPTAFNDALKLLKEWKYTDKDTGEEVNLGKSADWGSDTIVVIDSLTGLSEAAIRRAIKMMNKHPDTMTSAVWGAAVSDVNAAISIAGDKNLKYHLIVTGHLQMIGPDDYLKQGDTKEITEVKIENIAADVIATRLYPVAATRNSSSRVAKDFSTMILAEQKVVMGKTARVLTTSTKQPLDLKLPALNVPGELPIADGLSRIFTALGAKAPGKKGA